MRTTWIVMMLCFSLFTSHAQGSEDSAASAPLESLQAERSQHRVLALSLRNQQILEKQAESKARQLMFQLQAAEALSAMQQLNRSQDRPLQSNDATIHSEARTSLSVEQMALAALVRLGDEWVARITYGNRILRAKDGDTLLNQVHVQVDEAGVTLLHKGERYRLQGDPL